MKYRWLSGLAILLISFSCKIQDKPAKKPLSHLPIELKLTQFVNLLDSNQILDKQTVLNLTMDSSGIQFKVELEEDDIRYKRLERDAAIWKDPCFEFFFDPANDGLDYYELQINAAAQIWDLKLKTSKGRINAPENMIAWNSGDNFTRKIIGTGNSADDVDEQWSVSGHIAWDRFTEGRPKPGDIWAYNFMRVDYDRENRPSYWVAYPTGKEMIHYPETWPVLKF